MSETPLREVKNCGECPFCLPISTLPTDRGSNAFCHTAQEYINTTVLSFRCECVNRTRRDDLRRRVLEFEAQPQLGDTRIGPDGGTQHYYEHVEVPK